MSLSIRVMLSAALAFVPIAAQSQTLVIGMAAPVTSIDPHYRDLSPNETIASNIFDALTELDQGAHLQPDLAVSWRAVDSQTWEFKLRPGVTFQNGQPLTGDDVAFTIARVPNVPNALFTTYTGSIDQVSVPDPLTVRMHTRYVDPLLPLEMAQVKIISHIAAANATTGDFNDGKAAIGTGPYRLVTYLPSDRIDLVRSKDYWGTAPHWQKVTYRTISNDASRTAALIAGDVQLIDAVPPDSLPRLKSDPHVSLATVPGLRLIYIGLDQGRTGPTPFVTGPNGEILQHNPLRDLRVREALSLAIDRRALVDRILEGAATPSGQFLPAGSFSYVNGLQPPAYDPARAKQLLVEAGFPNGLRLTFHGPNDRYIDDGPIGQAIGQMWSRIGVRTTVEQLPWSVFFERCNDLDYSVYLGGWGTATGEASNALRALLATYDPRRGYGASNRGRYSSPALDDLLTQALRTPDDGTREQLLEKATKMAFDDVAIVPLYNQTNIWAMAKGLTYAARADELTLAADVQPAE
jgi:peptide/nickel transport system substrate-binding protein